LEELNIRRIYLVPEIWVSGVGEELFNRGIEEIRSQGYKKVILRVLDL
jgi:N-acetylglutamate synthase-like GNAT family acetyltransferase